ncbi:MAG: hypothetical protein V4446_15280 [Pseudomonadota bacterium]
MRRLRWLALIATAPACAAPLSWQTAFPIEQAPSQVYFQARYVNAQGQSHRLQIWRDGARLLRRTDDALDIEVTHDAAGAAQYRVFDYRRGIVTQVARSNLYRIGVFSEGFSLAHVLARPYGAFQLAVDLGQAPLSGDCNWIRISPAEGAPSQVCWSAQWGVPMEIRQSGQTVFQIEQLARNVPESFLQAARRNWITVDANQDIDPAAD